jgi:hypothetical protein
MTIVHLTATGRGIGASGEYDGFGEMIRTEIAHVAPSARPQIRVGSDDSVTVSVELPRGDQARVGEVLERLLQDAQIESSVIDEEPAE